MRFFFYLLGFGMSVIGGTTMIAYLNIMASRSDWKEYLLFISTKVECYFLPIGLFITWLSIFFPSHDDG
ncbi:hypothetical protein [Anoxybacillus sp. EFIL]|uniref:hypothetical protein n=1 Tax=unclassified Anoxybacillus TaxID=2639704 RepID=UPI00148DE8C6|nr:hypothetical protein [Anoxybacillus sp. EFIL]NNU95499.1 hypothetical protein [Anoxybacillus sp. EFIL]